MYQRALLHFRLNNVIRDRVFRCLRSAHLILGVGSRTYCVGPVAPCAAYSALDLLAPRTATTCACNFANFAFCWSCCSRASSITMRTDFQSLALQPFLLEPPRALHIPCRPHDDLHRPALLVDESVHLAHPRECWSRECRVPTVVV